MNEQDLLQLFASMPITILLLAPLPIVSFLLFKTLRSPHRNERFAPLVLLVFVDMLATIPWVGYFLYVSGFFDK